VTDEPNHPIDEPASALEGGTVLPPAGEAPLPAAVPAETVSSEPPTLQSLTPAESPVNEGTELPGPAAAPVEGGNGTLPPAPPPVEEVATPEIPKSGPEAEEGDSEEGTMVAVRRAPAKSSGKKAKAEAKPAAKPAAKRAAEPAAEPAAPVPKSENMNWYILKVQSNREDSIREGLLRRVAIAGLGFFFGEVIVPTEKVTEVKQGRKRVTKRKLYPGYLVVQMEINDDTWFLIRETPGIGDFTGAAGAPTPMLPHEVNRILQRSEEKTDQAPKLDIRVHAGDRVKINEGTFENFEGEVDNIDATNGRVTVMINIFGRSTPVELEYWQIEGL
jgi:transcriptional antiterminator NusG